jgi:hypothetical protein
MLSRYGKYSTCITKQLKIKKNVTREIDRAGHNRANLAMRKSLALTYRSEIRIFKVTNPETTKKISTPKKPRPPRSFR